MAQRFDELSKIFATGLSRRQALRWIGGALGGGVMASMVGIDQVMAAPGDCAVFCGKTAFTSGPAHASCLQACKQCGGDVNRVCTGSTGSVCCPPGATCCSQKGGSGTASCCPAGTSCCTNFATGATTCCAAGQVCDNGTCVTPTCSGHGCNVFCNPNVGCGCVMTTEGTTACVQEVCTFQSCTSSADCGPGSVCFTEGCCGGGNFCIPLCA